MRRNKNAYTLMELLIVVIIVVTLGGLLIALVAPRVKAKMAYTACQFQLEELHTAWRTHNWEHTTPAAEEVTAWLKTLGAKSYCPRHYVRYAYLGLRAQDGGLVTFMCQDPEHGDQSRYTSIEYVGKGRLSEVWSGRMIMKLGKAPGFQGIVTFNGGVTDHKLVSTITPAPIPENVSRQERLKILNRIGADPRMNPEMKGAK